jgi:hypothetical protein
VYVFPGWKEVFRGLIPEVPKVSAWALEKGVNPNSWNEILPLIAWGAGGFASQVWYTYWIIGAGYGMTQKDQYGVPADTDLLKKIDVSSAQKIKGWFSVVYADASLAIIIGVVVTCGFVLAGAGVLGPRHLAPEGPKLAVDLSNIFASKWGNLGGLLFMLGGAAALISTQIGQLAGWPRLLADSFRICIPRFSRIPWKKQYRGFLFFFFLTNMIIVFTLGYKPVALIKTSAVLDGLMLTPLQALWVFAGLYIVQPRLFNKEVSEILKPHWIFGVVLFIAFGVFTYFCVWQLPRLF